MTQYELEPASGTKVGFLQDFSVTFPDTPDGLAWPIDVASITLTAPDGSTVYNGCAATLGNSYRTLTFGFCAPESTNPLREQFTAAGDYTLTIPAGLMADEADKTMTNDVITATYTVDPSYNFSAV